MILTSFITYPTKWAQVPILLLLGIVSMTLKDKLEAEASPIILAFGNSLTAGYAVPNAESYPSKLQKILQENGFPHRVVNGGVSGDTTAGGLRRIHWLMKQNPKFVILELGANDGLRGQQISEMESNLGKIIEICLSKKAKVLLAGMKIPPNYGEDYTRDFEEVYHRLSKRYRIPLIPFFLEGVAGNRRLTQPDGMHPLSTGYIIVAETVWKHLKPML